MKKVPLILRKELNANSNRFFTLKDGEFQGNNTRYTNGKNT
jgi:hypothetical protein